MKNSYYNIYIPINEKESIIYNTLNLTLINIEEEKMKRLKNEDYSAFNESELKALIDNGFVIEDSLEERLIYQYKRNLAQFNYNKLHILYTVTDACNSNCEYCFKKNDKPEKVDPTKKDAINKFIVKQMLINKSEILQIDFFGGEPLVVYKDVIKIMEYFNKVADKHNVKVKYRFYTNGTLLNEKIIEYFKQNRERIKDIQITLDGPKEIHDKVRPLKTNESSYDKIITNLKILKENDIFIQLRINFNKENYIYIQECIEDLKKNNLQDIPISFYAVQAMSQACSKYELAITDEDTLKLFPQIWKMAIDNNLNINLKPAPGFVYCSASCKSSFILNYKGEVYKCALLQTDKKYKIGDINDDGDIDKLSNVYLKWMCKNPLSNPKCSVCKLLPICGGGCGGSAAEKYNDFEHENCFDMNMDLFIERMKLYYEQRYKDSNKIKRE